MKVFCVRHGEAKSVDVDPERGLTEQGVLDVTKVSEYLAGRGLTVSHVMHSAKQRAKQTAKIMAEHMQPESVTECDTLLDEESDVMPLVEMINSWNEDTVLVGHLPFMSKLVSALVINDENYFPIVNYPPGTVVCLEYCENKRWIINWLLRPDIVPEKAA